MGKRGPACKFAPAIIKEWFERYCAGETLEGIGLGIEPMLAGASVYYHIKKHHAMPSIHERIKSRKMMNVSREAVIEAYSSYKAGSVSLRSLAEGLHCTPANLCARFKMVPQYERELESINNARWKLAHLPEGRPIRPAEPKRQVYKPSTFIKPLTPQQLMIGRAR